MKKQKVILTMQIIALVLIVLLAVSCNQAANNKGGTDVKPDGKHPTTDNAGTGQNNGGVNNLESTQDLKKFDSRQDMIAFIENSLKNSGGTDYYSYGGSSRNTMALMSMDSAAPQAKSGGASMSESASSSGAGDFSSTNVQVAGVDEADFVKNDNKYIYTITQNKLIIVDAYPAANAEIVSKTEIKGRPRNMLVNEDRLVVFSDDNSEAYTIYQYDFVPRPSYAQTTHAYVYDITDRSNPKLLNDYNMNGYYLESRMIKNHVYFIVQDNVNYYNRILNVPMVKSASNVIVEPEVFYFDNPETNYNFNTVASFDIFGDDNGVNAKTFMMGYASTIYVSENNIYIAYQKSFPYYYYDSQNEDRFYKVVVPLLTSDAKNKINDLKDDSSIDAYQKWDKISSVLESMYNDMGKEERESTVNRINDAVEEYESKLEVERRKTVIHRIAIDNGAIEHKAKGEVSGYLLNQFSMDENNGNLRVATTFEFYGRSPIMFAEKGIAVSEASVSPSSPISASAVQTDLAGVAEPSNAKIAPITIPSPRSEYVMYNNVYALDEDMKQIGALEALAFDERIYSTRFIGDRLYMVTFKRVDPLFVIDLSNPEKPEVLGKLKIPGFSDYLHPYDEDHIIGIGKETEGNEWGGVSTKGVKIALFDVSDVTEPKQLAKYEIGDSGTDSEALRDHKAFLFDKSKNLLVIPITEIDGKPVYDSKLGYYRQTMWQGAYVFDLSLDGFKVEGKITHNDGNERQDYYWYGSPNSVRRSLFMDNVLYTVSSGKIKANDLDNVEDELAEVKLPYEEQKMYDYPIYWR